MSSIKTVYPAETSGGTVTKFIPLTSVFSYPMACSKSLLKDGNTLEAFDPNYYGLVSTMSCVPPAVLSSAFAPNQDMLVPTRLSIGPFTCPNSWSTLSQSTKDQTSTFALCCPPGYNTLSGTFCVSDVTKNEVLTYASASQQSGSSAQLDIVTSTAGQNFQVLASAMQGWNIRSTSTPTPPTGTDGAASNGLSTGAKAAIGVCVPVGVLLIVALLAVFIIRHRKRASAAKKAVDRRPDADNVESQPYGQKAELPGEGNQTGELPGNEPTEIDGSQIPVAALEVPAGGETAADQTVHELPATPATQEGPKQEVPQ